ncbi:class I SAM-dependent methyltransferase [Inquilinus sp. CA228]|uniref:class I SAM-dependent methyltransferase n=1 Tax=Inquilinus sp. CA228 TaxID=3455609 RepID=UPI003F8D8B9E
MATHGEDAHYLFPETADVTIFQESWNIYQKMVENNFLFHREVYTRLHDVLIGDVGRPFDFLDIACGDARASVAALQGTQAAHYHGIDLSVVALEFARQACEALTLPATLEEGDFRRVIALRTDPADVVWIGLSLHHLRNPEKLAFMRDVRRLLGPDGLLLIYENTSPDGEDREGWLRRWDQQKPFWTAYTDAEWDAMAAHVHDSDFPETESAWRELGRAGGFGRVSEVFAAPSDLFRMYCFAA